MFPPSKAKPIRKNETKRVAQRDPSVPRIGGPRVTLPRDWDTEEPPERRSVKVVSKDPKDQPGAAGKSFGGRWTAEELEMANRPRIYRSRYMAGLDRDSEFVIDRFRNVR